MSFELYLDSFFLLNLCMDVILLLFVKRILGCTAAHLRIFLAASAGAGAACLLTVLPFVPGVCKLFIGYGLVSMGMVCVSFRLKDFRIVLKGTLILYGFAFFMGGFLELLTVHVPFFRKNGWHVISLLSVSYGLYASFSFLYQRWRRKENLLQVKLRLGEKETELMALLDTGNSLYEPVSKKPVSLVEADAIQALMQERRPEDFCIIPYHSVGKAHGLLEGMEIAQMEIYAPHEKIKIERPVVGIYKGKLSGKSGRYQMILHPALTDSV